MCVLCLKCVYVYSPNFLLSPLTNTTPSLYTRVYNTHLCYIHLPTPHSSSHYCTTEPQKAHVIEDLSSSDLNQPLFLQPTESVMLLAPSDAEWLPAPPGRLQVQEVLQKLPPDPPPHHSDPGPLSGLPDPTDVLATAARCVDHPGLYPGHDRPPPLPQA